MKLNVLFIITAIIAIVYGVVFVIIPGPVYSIYGIESNMMLNYMGRRSQIGPDYMPHLDRQKYQSVDVIRCEYVQLYGYL